MSRHQRTCSATPAAGPPAGCRTCNLRLRVGGGRRAPLRVPGVLVVLLPCLPMRRWRRRPRAPRHVVRRRVRRPTARVGRGAAAARGVARGELPRGRALPRAAAARDACGQHQAVAPSASRRSPRPAAATTTRARAAGCASAGTVAATMRCGRRGTPAPPPAPSGSTSGGTTRSSPSPPPPPQRPPRRSRCPTTCATC